MVGVVTKLPRIIYFLQGMVPTEEEQAEALELHPATVVYRNASFVPDIGSLEHCDGVAGSVPARYADAYPRAEQVIITALEVRNASILKSRKAAELKDSAQTDADKETAKAAKAAKEAAAKAKADEEKVAAAKAKAAENGAAWKPNA